MVKVRWWRLDFGGDGTEFTGDNGFTVTDPNHPESSWTYDPSQAAAANGTTQLGTYTDSEGTVYTGDGFTVTDSFTCGSGDCGLALEPAAKHQGGR